jgi:hypothetical protein
LVHPKTLASTVLAFWLGPHFSERNHFVVCANLQFGKVVSAKTKACPLDGRIWLCFHRCLQFELFLLLSLEREHAVLHIFLPCFAFVAEEGQGRAKPFFFMASHFNFDGSDPYARVDVGGRRPIFFFVLLFILQRGMRPFETLENRNHWSFDFDFNSHPDFSLQRVLGGMEV